MTTYRTHMVDNQMGFGSGSKINADDIPDSNTRFWLTDTTQEISGSKIFGNNLDMSFNAIINVTDPTSNQDAATKKYVDDNAGGAASATLQDICDNGFTTTTNITMGQRLTIDSPTNGSYLEGYSVSGNITMTSEGYITLMPQTDGIYNRSYNFYMGAQQADGDQYIYFRDGGSDTGRYLKWNDNNNRFEMNDTLYADSYLVPSATTVEGATKGIGRALTDDFIFPSTSYYILHYGMSWGIPFNDGNGTAGANMSISSYWGTEFFTGGISRMRINYHGEVGIGTRPTHGGEKLQVAGNIAINANSAADGDSYLYFYEGGSATGAYLMFDDSADAFVMNHALKAPYFEATNTNNQMVFRAGNDADIWDINVANTLGIYGRSDPTKCSVKLGSGGGYIHGESGKIGVTGDFQINYSGGDGDSYLYFYEGSSTGRYLKWAHTDNRFEMNDSLNVGGGLYAEYGFMHGGQSTSNNSKFARYMFNRGTGSNPDRWWKIATLPVTTAGTGDHLLLKGRYSEAESERWYTFTVEVSNRNNFYAKIVDMQGASAYKQYGAVECYNSGTGTAVDVYIKLSNPRYSGMTLDAVSFGWGAQATLIDPSEVTYTETDPVGTKTLVFDMLDTATVPDSPSYFGDLYSNGNMYINYNGGDGDSYLYFYEGGSTTGRYLKWDDSSNAFEFNDVLSMTNNSICNLAIPFSSGDAANKTYVDNASDLKFKTNITPLENCLDNVNKLKPVKFNWNKSGKEYSKDNFADTEIGLIAQDIKEIYPEVVFDKADGEGSLAIDYPKLTAVLIKAVQELTEKVNHLENDNK